MKVFEPDFSRYIDIPGTGPCRRPVDIDHAKTGFGDLVSLRVYSFDRDMVIEGEAEDDEVFVVVMRGRADIRVTDVHGKTDDFARMGDGEFRAVYLPPQAHYRLWAMTDCDVAYARATPAPAGWPGARAFAASDGRLHVDDHAGGMAITLTTIAPGDTLAIGTQEMERFLHVRTSNEGAATVADRSLRNWQSAALAPGEHAALKVERDEIELLTVSASAR